MPTMLVLLLASFPGAEPEAAVSLYKKSYKEPGFAVTITELARTANTSRLKIETVKSDAQGGPFAVIRAACEIGEAMKLRYFTVVSSMGKDGDEFLTLYFTANRDEPAPKNMSPEARKRFNSVGFLDAEQFRKIFSRDAADDSE